VVLVLGLMCVARGECAWIAHDFACYRCPRILSDYPAVSTESSGESHVGADCASLNECIHGLSSSKGRTARANIAELKMCRILYAWFFFLKSEI